MRGGGDEMFHKSKRIFADLTDRRVLKFRHVGEIKTHYGVHVHACTFCSFRPLWWPPLDAPCMFLSVARLQRSGAVFHAVT